MNDKLPFHRPTVLSIEAERGIRGLWFIRLLNAVPGRPLFSFGVVFIGIPLLGLCVYGLQTAGLDAILLDWPTALASALVMVGTLVLNRARSSAALAAPVVRNQAAKIHVVSTAVLLFGLPVGSAVVGRALAITGACRLSEYPARCFSLFCAAAGLALATAVGKSVVGCYKEKLDGFAQGLVEPAELSRMVDRAARVLQTRSLSITCMLGWIGMLAWRCTVAFPKPIFDAFPMALRSAPAVADTITSPVAQRLFYTPIDWYILAAFCLVMIVMGWATVALVLAAGVPALLRRLRVKPTPVGIASAYVVGDIASWGSVAFFAGVTFSAPVLLLSDTVGYTVLGLQIAIGVGIFALPLGAFWPNVSRARAELRSSELSKLNSAFLNQDGVSRIELLPAYFALQFIASQKLQLKNAVGAARVFAGALVSAAVSAYVSQVWPR